MYSSAENWMLKKFSLCDRTISRSARNPGTGVCLIRKSLSCTAGAYVRTRMSRGSNRLNPATPPKYILPSRER